MTSKEKVLKIEPDAVLKGIRGNYHIAVPFGKHLAKNCQRQSWAWAEAVRVLKGQNKL